MTRKNIKEREQEEQKLSESENQAIMDGKEFNQMFACTHRQDAQDKQDIRKK